MRPTRLTKPTARPPHRLPALTITEAHPLEGYSAASVLHLDQRQINGRIVPWSDKAVLENLKNRYIGLLKSLYPLIFRRTRLSRRNKLAILRTIITLAEATSSLCPSSRSPLGIRPRLAPRCVTRFSLRFLPAQRRVPRGGRDRSCWEKPNNLNEVSITRRPAFTVIIQSFVLEIEQHFQN